MVNGRLVEMSGPDLQSMKARLVKVM
jgi:hypothetical protein